VSTVTHEVYGLHLSGTPAAGLPPASGTSTPVVVRHARQSPEPAGIGGERVVLDLPGDRQLVAQRNTGSAIFTGPPLSDDELVHPYLGAAASIFSRWAGREVFHAGAFVADELAWAVVGAREAGKSSLLASLAAHGWPVLADDLVVTDGHQVFCGPRTIDLRQPLPGSAAPVTRARDTTRWRLSLPPAPRAVPLGGWIYLRWQAEVSMHAVPASVLLARLAAGRTWPTLPSDPRTLLALAACPGWDLGRPADWARMDEAVRVMLRTLPRSPGVRIRPGSQEIRPRHTPPGNGPHPAQPPRV
jgi:hypothetical protein